MGELKAPRSGAFVSYIRPRRSRIQPVHRGQGCSVCERFAGFDSVDAFQDWADFYILSGRPFEDGCSLGALASEIVKTDLDIHDQLARAFEQWRDIFREGLERMKRLGRIDASADPVRLAHMFVAAYQGGMLLAEIARDITPLRDSLYAAVDHLRTFALAPDGASDS
jgi:AcrR family transcriptional regulator